MTAKATVKRADLGTGTNTNAASRGYARGLGNADDDAGHMIGKQLGGSGGKKNVFPQDFHVNRGEFAQFEGRVADFVGLHGQADIQIKNFCLKPLLCLMHIIRMNEKHFYRVSATRPIVSY